MAISLKGLHGPDNLPVDASPSGFHNSGQHPALWQAGNPAAFAAAGLEKEALRFAATLDDLAVNDFLLKTSKELEADYANPQHGQFNTRKGQAALGMFREWQERSQRIWNEEAPTRLSARQLDMAKKPLAALFMATGRKVASHEAEQVLDWRRQTAELALNDAANLIAASPFDMENIGLGMASIRKSCAALGTMHGWDEAHTRSRADRAIGTALARGATTLAETRPDMALGFLRLHKEMIPEEAFQGAEAAVQKKIRARAREEQAAADRQKVHDAYAAVEGLPSEKAIEYLTSPEARNHLGLSDEQAVKVAGLLHTRDTWQKRAERNARDAAQSAVLTEAVNLTLGMNGREADPVAACRMVQEDPSLDGKTRSDTLKALREGRLDVDDPGFVSELTSRIARADPDAPPAGDVELARAVAAGKMRFETRDRLAGFRAAASGPQGHSIRNALRSIDEAFARSATAAGTPEQAAAHFAAQSELLFAIAEARAGGNLSDLLNPQSKNCILPGIVARNRLSVKQAMAAAVNRCARESRAAEAEKSAQKRRPGESIQDYLQRNAS